MTRRRLAGAVALVLFAVLLGGIVNLMQARSLANQARSTILSAVAIAEEGELEEARDALRDAVDRLETARARIDSPWASLVGAVPYVHTEIRAGAAGITAVREATLAILDILEFVVADRPPLFSAGRLQTASLTLLEDSLATALDHAVAAQEAVRAAPRPRMGSVREPLAEVEETAATLLDVLSGARPLTAQIANAVGGGDPYRIFVLFENAAEQRATGGFMGFYAALLVDDAEVRIENAEAITGLRARDENGELLRVEAPADFVRRYGGFLADTTLWVNVNLSPDFPTVASVADRLYRAAVGVNPDLIVRIDLDGLGYILEAFSGLAVDGLAIDPDLFATDFVLDSYRRFPNNAEQNAYLASAVRQVFDQVLGGPDADLSRLFRGLRRAASERRVALATRDPVASRMVAALDVDGGVQPGDPGDVEVIVQNFGANKVDLFTNTEIGVAVRSSRCLLTGEVTITLGNGVPDGVDLSANSSYGNLGRWWASVYLPADANIIDITVDGSPSGGTTDIEFGRPVASVLISAEPGSTTSATFQWQEQLIASDYRLRVQPQPVVVPATLAMNGEEPMLFVETITSVVPTDCRP